MNDRKKTTKQIQHKTHQNYQQQLERQPHQKQHHEYVEIIGDLMMNKIEERGLCKNHRVKVKNIPDPHQTCISKNTRQDDNHPCWHKLKKNTSKVLKIW